MSDEPFGFPQAEIPAATPLSESWARGDLERELRDLFAELFTDTLGTETFDASVLGAPHLGSFDLVRAMVGHDGLVLLRGEREEQAARYLYRAWRSEDVQGRGLHFLRTYLQLLVPNGAEVRQLWHDKRFPYGDALVINEPRLILTNFLGRPGLRLDGAWAVGAPTVEPNEEPPVYEPDQAYLWLTSRIQLKLSLETAAESAYSIDGRSVLGSLIEIIRTVIPARLVPGFLFWLAFELYIRIHVSRRFVMRKSLTHGYPWCGRSLSEYPDRRWSLGIDGKVVQLPLPFGSFRVGEMRGQIADWQLTGCRAARTMTGRLFSAASAYRLPMIGEPDRRLDGTWALSRRQADALSRAALEKRVGVLQAQRITARHCETIRIDYPFTPRSLDQTRALDGHWSLGKGAPAIGQPFHGRTLNGFRIGRSTSVLVENDRARKHAITLYAAPQPLARDDESRPLWQPVRLDGRWGLGRLKAPETLLMLRGRYAADAPVFCTTRKHISKQISLHTPYTPRRLSRYRGLGAHWQLRDGEALSQLRYGGSVLDGFSLGRPSVVVRRALALRQSAASVASPERLSRQYRFRLKRWPRQLDGEWALGALRRLDGRWTLDGQSPLKARKMTHCHRLNDGRLMLNDSGPAEPSIERHARSPWPRALNGRWQIGAPAQHPEFTLMINKGAAYG